MWHYFRIDWSSWPCPTPRLFENSPEPAFASKPELSDPIAQPTTTFADLVEGSKPVPKASVESFRHRSACALAASSLDELPEDRAARKKLTWNLAAAGECISKSINGPCAHAPAAKRPKPESGALPRRTLLRNTLAATTNAATARSIQSFQL